MEHPSESNSGSPQSTGDGAAARSLEIAEAGAKLQELAHLYEGTYKPFYMDQMSVEAGARMGLMSRAEVELFHRVDHDTAAQALLHGIVEHAQQMKELDEQTLRIWADTTISTRPFHELQEAGENMREGREAVTANIFGALGMHIGQLYYPGDVHMQNAVAGLAANVGELWNLSAEVGHEYIEAHPSPAEKAEASEHRTGFRPGDPLIEDRGPAHGHLSYNPDHDETHAAGHGGGGQVGGESGHDGHQAAVHDRGHAEPGLVHAPHPPLPHGPVALHPAHHDQGQITVSPEMLAIGQQLFDPSGQHGHSHPDAIIDPSGGHVTIHHLDSLHGAHASVDPSQPIDHHHQGPHSGDAAHAVGHNVAPADPGHSVHDIGGGGDLNHGHGQ